ncbi:MAG: Na+/H+ antiporter subunit C [Verrucomicrobiota bacterium]
MNLMLAIIIGILMSTGVYCLFRRSLFRLIIGIMLISQAANLIVFASARVTRASPALISPNQKILEAPYADPLPQALVLTAIVISFGFIAFALALIHRAYKILGHDDVNKFNQTDQIS